MELQGAKNVCMYDGLRRVAESFMAALGRTLLSTQHWAHIVSPFTASPVFLLFVGQLSHTSSVLNHMEHVFVWTFMIEDICLSPVFAFRGSLHHLMVQLTACFASCSWLYIVWGDFTVFTQKKENKTKRRDFWGVHVFSFYFLSFFSSVNTYCVCFLW